MSKKVLLIGDSPHLHSGFARVLREIGAGLVNAGHEVKCIGWVYQGEPHDLPFQIISPLDFQRDYYGIQQTRTVINMWEPDILFSLGDPWMIDWIKDIPERKKVKWIGYFPVDGTPFPKAWADVVEDMDIPIVYSKFGYDLVKEKLPDKDIKLILHGVDTDVFKPLLKKEVEEFKKANGLDGKYIVTCIARNQWRKNLPALFKAFAEFSKDKDDVILYYHGAVRDVGWNIVDLVERNGLEGKVVLAKEITPNKGVSNEVLNMIYNIGDLMTIPFLGEGYGLPMAECHSVGRPILVTDFSTANELTVSEHERIKVATYYTPSNGEKGYAIDYALVDHNDYVKKLNNFYYNRELGKELGKLGRKWALENTWSKFTGEFIDLFKEVK